MAVLMHNSWCMGAISLTYSPKNEIVCSQSRRKFKDNAKLFPKLVVEIYTPLQQWFLEQFQLLGYGQRRDLGRLRDCPMHMIKGTGN